MLVGCGVDFAPGTATTDPDRARTGIDLDLFQAGKVDYHAAVTGSQSGAVVTTAAHGEQEPLLAGEVDHLCHIVGAGAARHQGGPPIDHRVVDLARLLIGAVLGAYELPFEARYVRCAGGVHVFSLPSSEIRLSRG